MNKEEDNLPNVFVKLWIIQLVSEVNNLIAKTFTVANISSFLILLHAHFKKRIGYSSCIHASERFVSLRTDRPRCDNLVLLRSNS